MKLSEVSKDKIPIGLKVWNAEHTQTGIITEIMPEDREDISIAIKWDNGNESCPWHFWCDQIEIVAPSCCHACSFEKSKGRCSLLETALDKVFADDPDGGCPPIHKCPLMEGNRLDEEPGC